MNIVLTGATGFIGQRLAEYLIQQGMTVRAYVRSTEKARKTLHAQAEIYQGQLLDEAAFDQALEGCDAVIHLAAFAKVWHQDMTMFQRINVDATKLLLDRAIRHGVQRVILISTAGVLGPARNGIPIDESAYPPQVFFTEYDRTKYQAEVLMEQYRDRIHTTTLNVTRVFGPGPVQVSNSVTQLLVKYLDGKWRMLPGDGDQYGNYVFIDDIVQSITAALQIERSGERFILGGENVTFNALFGHFRELTGKTYRMVPIPLWLGKLYGAFEVARARLTDHSPMITPAFATRYAHDWIFSSAKAERELGHRITPFSQALELTMQWLESQDALPHRMQ